MLKTIKAVLEKDGSICLLEKVNLEHAGCVLVTIMDEDNAREEAPEAALLSEASLAEDWNRPEENEAWRHLQ